MSIEHAESVKQQQGSFSGNMNQKWRGSLLMLALAVVAVISGCAGVESGQNIKPPSQVAIQVTPSSVNLGSTTVGKRVSHTASVTNTGNTAVMISQASLSSSYFDITGIVFPLSLLAGQTANFTVWFNAMSACKATGALVLTSESGVSSVPVELSGTATNAQPQLSASPASVSFGSVTLGWEGTSTVTLTNSGSADLNVYLITVNGAPFGISGITTPKAIPAGQSAAFSVTFSPAASGNASGSLSITNNDPRSQTTIALSGSGTDAPVGQLTVNPTSLNFGRVNVGSNSALNATLTNSGQLVAHISQVNVTGSGFTASGFSVPTTLNAGQSTALQLKYAPAAGGTANGSASIVSDAQGSPATLSLSGAGMQAAISVSPATINFGSVVDGVSKSQSFTITNTGNANLTIAQATLTGNGFSVSGLSTPLTIAAGHTGSFSLQFTPWAAGNLNGSLSLVSNAPNSPAAITLSGTGTTASFAISTSPSSVSFGSISAGSAASQSVSVSNTGNANVTISRINVSGSDFSASGIATPVTLVPSQRISLNVKFHPTSSGAASGSVALVNTQGTSATVSISGTGVQPGLSATPASISFSNVVTGTANSQTVQITNTGNTNLTISQATVTGRGFSTNGISVPLVIAAEQSTSFIVQFAPQAAGSVSGSLSLVSNAPNSPSTLVLSGVGVEATRTLSVSPTSLGFRSVTTGSSTSQKVSISNTGNSKVTISQIIVSGAGFSASGAGLSVTLSPSQSVTMIVQFAPQSAGRASGSISVVSDATGSPATVAISGTGVAR